MKSIIIVLVLLVITCSILVQVDLNLPLKYLSFALSYGVLKYILTILVAISIGLLAARLDTRQKKLFHNTIIPCCILVLCGLMLTALAQSDSGWPCNRWVYFGPFSIQPSEFLRLAIAVGVTIVVIKLEGRQKVPLRYIALVGLALILLIIEGDLSTLLLLTLTMGASFYYFGRSRWICAVLFTFTLLVFFLFVLHMNELKSRIATYSETKHQRSQVSIALSSIRAAPVFGQTIDPRIEQIPLGNRDFFFAKSIRTYGRFFGVSLFLSCLAIPLLACKHYIRFREALIYDTLCLCWATFYITETLLHVYVNLALLPVMGVNLPLASLGGSSMVVHLGFLTFIISLSSDPLVEKSRGLDQQTYKRGQNLVCMAKILSIIALIRLLLL